MNQESEQEPNEWILLCGGSENLYLRTLVELYHKTNRKYVFLCFYTVIETLVIVLENSK